MQTKMKSKRTIGTSKSKNVTFAEFIQHLTDPDTFETSNNPHWERYSELSQHLSIFIEQVNDYYSNDILK
jgi:hypothetical protein